MAMINEDKKKLISRRQFLAGSGTVIVAIAFAACSPKTSGITTQAPSTPSTLTPSTLASSSTPKYGGVLRQISTTIGLSNIGWPSQMSMGPAATVTQVCLETLLRGDNKGNLYPWLAESYKIADDLKSITFDLRKGVKFHDGSDFNAEVAKWNLDNYINPFAEPNWASVDILGDYSIRVNFTQWNNTLPVSFGDASMSPASMVSKAAFDKHGIEWMKENPVGTGPFKFESFQTDVIMKVVRNPDYWVKGKPYLDGMEIIIIADPTTQKMTMKLGEADMVAIPNAKEASEYAAMGMTAKTIASATQILIPDTANVDSPWANKKVREAVEYAIDRETIARALGYGYLQAPYQIPPRYSLAYDPDFALGRKYDPEKAKQLLAEGGYPDGFKTTIIVFTMADRNVVLALQADLAKVGIQANLDYPDAGRWDSYTGPSATWPKNAALYFPLPTMDINFIGGLQFMFNIFGQSWLRTPEVKQAYQASQTSTTIDVKMVRAVTDMITKDASLIPVFEGVSGMAMQSYVLDTGILSRGNQQYWNTEDTWFNK